jgi:hypothetical protein
MLATKMVLYVILVIVSLADKPPSNVPVYNQNMAICTRMYLTWHNPNSCVHVKPLV